MEAFYFTPILLFLVERGAEKKREREREREGVVVRSTTEKGACKSDSIPMLRIL